MKMSNTIIIMIMNEKELELKLNKINKQKQIDRQTVVNGSATQMNRMNRELVRH